MKVLPLFLVAFLASCTVSTASDGSSVSRPDQEALTPWLWLARDVFATTQQAPAPEAIVVPAK